MNDPETVTTNEISAAGDVDPIRGILDQNRKQIRQGLRMCAHCALCAESCFLYVASDHDPMYMPSYKFINGIGLIYKKKGTIGPEAMAAVGTLVFDHCVLCMRCYCPFGIDIPALITLGRRVCRSQGVFRVYHAEDPLT